MNEKEKSALVMFKITKAKETFEEVDVNIKNKLWNSAVNRLYYACFYAVNALLLHNEIKARKHSGVIQMFGLHFILPGIISKEAGKFYTELFDMRQSGDYEDFIYFEEIEVVPLIDPAKQFINQIEHLLSKQ